MDDNISIELVGGGDGSQPKDQNNELNQFIAEQIMGWRTYTIKGEVYSISDEKQPWGWRFCPAENMDRALDALDKFFRQHDLYVRIASDWGSPWTVEIEDPTEIRDGTATDASLARAICLALQAAIEAGK